MGATLAAHLEHRAALLILDTMSTWPPPAARCARRCCGCALACAAWPPAARCWLCRGRWWGGSRRYRCRTRGRPAAAWPDFSLTSHNAPLIAHICWPLDGLPLAIELAAALARALSVEQIATRLQGHDRLAPGGVLQVLLKLVDKSLVTVQARSGETRCHMLNTIRQYAFDRLIEAGEAGLARDRQLDYCRRLAERAEPHLWRADQSEWFDRLEPEHDNLRAALEWSSGPAGAGSAPRVIAGLHLAKSVLIFWDSRGYNSEGAAWLATCGWRSGASRPAPGATSESTAPRPMLAPSAPCKPTGRMAHPCPPTSPRARLVGPTS